MQLTKPEPKFAPQLIPAPVEELYKEVVPKVLAPMDRMEAGARVDIEWLQKRLSEVRARPNRNTVLFKGVDKTSIEFGKK